MIFHSNAFALLAVLWKCFNAKLIEYKYILTSIFNNFRHCQPFMENVIIHSIFINHLLLDVKLILTTVFFTIATLSYTSMVYTYNKFRWNSSFQQNISTFHDIFNLANYMIKYVLIFEYKIYTYEISVCNRRYVLKRRKGIINKNNLKFSLYKFTEIRSHFVTS